MRVSYSRRIGGIGELCTVTRCTLPESTTCAKCAQEIARDRLCWELRTPEGHIYYLHDSCYADAVSAL